MFYLSCFCLVTISYFLVGFIFLLVLYIQLAWYRIFRLDILCTEAKRLNVSLLLLYVNDNLAVISLNICYLLALDKCILFLLSINILVVHCFHGMTFIWYNFQQFFSNILKMCLLWTYYGLLIDYRRSQLKHKAQEQFQVLSWRVICFI